MGPGHSRRDAPAAAGRPALTDHHHHERRAAGHGGPVGGHQRTPSAQRVAGGGSDGNESHLQPELMGSDDNIHGDQEAASDDELHRAQALGKSEFPRPRRTGVGDDDLPAGPRQALLLGMGPGLSRRDALAAAGRRTLTDHHHHERRPAGHGGPVGGHQRTPSAQCVAGGSSDGNNASHLQPELVGSNNNNHGGREDATDDESLRAQAPRKSELLRPRRVGGGGDGFDDGQA